MMSTRRRRRRFPVKRLVSFLVLVAVGFVLVREPMTHKLIFDGPAKPVWTQASNIETRFIKPVADPLLKPFSFVAQQQKLRARATEIATLKSEVSDAQSDAANDKKALADLQKRYNQLRTAKTQAPVVAPAANGAPGAAGGDANAAAVATVTPSPDEQKTATYWTSMDAENAAAIAQKLDPEEAARIFAAMKPDQAAEIMDSLPATYNVKLEAVHLSYVKPPAPAQ